MLERALDKQEACIVLQDKHLALEEDYKTQADEKLALHKRVAELEQIVAKKQEHTGLPGHHQQLRRMEDENFSAGSGPRRGFHATTSDAPHGSRSNRLHSTRKTWTGDATPIAASRTAGNMDGHCDIYSCLT
ncbi:hypothetical protein E8E11_000991 [Didymella keratinophila]|nr:hypothetical protein E8E11_000991 [Didymella keratinophila]